MQGRHWAALLGRLTCTPGTFREEGVLREMVGIGPLLPSLLPQQPECSFGARCPGRPGRCAAHVKHTRVQAREALACVGLVPHAWAPAASVGSLTHLSPGPPWGHRTAPNLGTPVPV